MPSLAQQVLLTAASRVLHVRSASGSEAPKVKPHTSVMEIQGGGQADESGTSVSETQMGMGSSSHDTSPHNQSEHSTEAMMNRERTREDEGGEGSDVWSAKPLPPMPPPTPLSGIRPSNTSPPPPGLTSMNEEPLTTLPVVVTPPPQNDNTHVPAHDALRPASTPPSPHSGTILPEREVEDGSPVRSSFGSPPPYYTVIYDQQDVPRTPPSTGGSAGNQLSPASPNGYDQQRGVSNSHNSISSQRRTRIRPPLPIGPRRPSTTGVLRQRSGSISSIGSNAPQYQQRGRVASSSAPLPSPKFQSPPMKWRGYTMEAAKWTFTSAELQGIVSRAIRQSAEASSIRLLRLETLDRDIPEEMHRLEMQRTDAKTRYKMLARRRAGLLASLSSLSDGHFDRGNTLDDLGRLVENLKEISLELDKLAEDLHCADEQIAQLTQLRDIHSASALAMALRKLNASFLKQFAQSQSLRTQVESLEAERDEAWKNAESVANEYDRLNERVEASGDPGSSTKRSSRVMASRKSSIRVSRAGLRSARASQRSSISSNHRMSSSGMPTSATMDDIVPPVPPIPRHRPIDIVTDLPSRTSAVCPLFPLFFHSVSHEHLQAMSTDGPTPSSETRAMVRAQEELYELLGIPMNDSRNARRSHSAIMSPPVSSTESQHFLSAGQSARRPDSSRPSSLPADSTLADVYNIMTADVSILLGSSCRYSDLPLSATLCWLHLAYSPTDLLIPPYLRS